MKECFLRAGVQWLFVLLLLTSRSVAPLYAQSSKDEDFLATLGQLRNATFEDKENIVGKLAQSGHPNVRAVLTAFLEGRLYFRNQDQKIFLVKPGAEDAATLDLIDPLTMKAAGSASSDDLTKVVANNRLRRVLETTLARFGLVSTDPSVRLDAVRDIERDLNEGNVQLLRERNSVETDFTVKKEIATGLALAALDGSDSQARLAAIATLRQSLRQDVLNRLEALLEKSADGNFTESDEHVRQAAAVAVKSINRWRGFYSDVQTLFFGLSLGSVLVLIAIGLAITV
jgi:urea transport system permease protein